MILFEPLQIILNILSVSFDIRCPEKTFNLIVYNLSGIHYMYLKVIL